MRARSRGVMEVLDYPFSSADLERASKEWGCNCGPSALAFALQMPLEYARTIIPEFERKKYTSPTMMKAALANAGLSFEAVKCPKEADIFSGEPEQPVLVRAQWTGPWTESGTNPRWAYWYTHWFAAWRTERNECKIFDCNGGIMSPRDWELDIMPVLANCHKRAYGGWFPTHVWKLPTDKPAPQQAEPGAEG